MKEADQDMIMGLACPPLDNFFGFDLPNLLACDLSDVFDDLDDNGNFMPKPSSSPPLPQHSISADDQRLLDEIFECFSNPLSEPMIQDDISGPFFNLREIQGRASSIIGNGDRAEKKGLGLKQHHGKGKEMRLLLKSRESTQHGKGKQMKIVLESRESMKHGKGKEINPCLFNKSSEPKKRAAPTDEQVSVAKRQIVDPCLFNQSIESKKRAAPTHEEASLAKRQRQIVPVKPHPLLPKPKPCRRFKSKILQRLYQKC